MSYIYLRSKERDEGTIPLLKQGCIAVDGIQFGIGVAALEDDDDPLGSADVLIDTHRLLLSRRERQEVGDVLFVAKTADEQSTDQHEGYKQRPEEGVAGS